MGISYHQETQLKKRRQFISRTNRVIVSVVITAGVLGYLLFFAKLFDVRTVEVRSPSVISTDAIRIKVDDVLNKKYLGIGRRSNIFIFSPQHIATVLAEEFPRIASIDIRRTSLHSIAIVIKERVAVGLWCLPVRERCYYFDAHGDSFLEILPSSGSIFTPINDFRERRIEIGENVAGSDWRENIFGVKKILQFGGITVVNFTIPEDSYDEFQAMTNEGWNILYSKDINTRRQTDSLLLFLKEKITPEVRTTLEYVDLRIEDRIYYK